MYHVYILLCSDNSIYIGQTSNLGLRLRRHNEGHASHHTSARRPVRLIYSEPHIDRRSAVHRERQIKRWTRAKKEALIRGDLEALRRPGRRRR